MCVKKWYTAREEERKKLEAQKTVLLDEMIANKAKAFTYARMLYELEGRLDEVR